MENTITTSVSKLSLDEHGIVHMTFLEKNMEIQGADSKEILEARVKLPTKGTKQLILTDLRSNPRPDREAREYARSPEMVETTAALALIVSNPLSRVLGNFFIGFNKGEFPVHIFSTEEDAISWLLKNKSEND